jgi:hypothetical protein
MDIAFSCTKCGQHIAVDEAGAGMSVPCPTCGANLTIPPKPVWLVAVNETAYAELKKILEGRNNPNEMGLALNKVLKECNYRHAPGTEGTIQDLRSIERQNLFIDTNVQIARGAGKAIQDNDPEAVDQYPAYELVRGMFSEFPRGDPHYKPGTDGAVGWKERWQDALDESGDKDAARVFEQTGRMIALKSSPVWQALGDGAGGREDALGNYFEPFAWGSGMVRGEIDRQECEDVGLLEPGEEVEGAAPPELTESFKQKSKVEQQEILEDLLASIEDYARLHGGFLRIRGGKLVEMSNVKETKKPTEQHPRVKDEKVEGAKPPRINDGSEQDSGIVTDFLGNTLLALQQRFIPIEDERMTKWLWNQPEKCCHCGEAKPRKVLCECDDCGEKICPDCKAKGCSGPIVPEPRNAFDCFNQAVSEMGGEFPLEKDVAERVLQWCDRAFEFGFAPHHRWHTARTHRMRGEALESLGQKERALHEYELAMEKDPKVGVKKRIASLRKECGKL